MKKIVQFLLVLSIVAAAAALWELGRVWVGYSLGEAFNGTGIFRTREDFETEHQIRLWAGYFAVAVLVASTLLVTYIRNYREQKRRQ